MLPLRPLQDSQRPEVRNSQLFGGKSLIRRIETVGTLLKAYGAEALLDSPHLHVATRDLSCGLGGSGAEDGAAAALAKKQAMELICTENLHLFLARSGGNAAQARAQLVRCLDSISDANNFLQYPLLLRPRLLAAVAVPPATGACGYNRPCAHQICR